MRNTCRYCGASTELKIDRKSKRWKSFEIGTTIRHRCEHWPTTEPAVNLHARQ